MTDAPALAVEDLVAGYGGVARAGRRLDRRPGRARSPRCSAPTGPGKTTLLRTISGLVRPRPRQVLLDGADLARRRPEDIARAGVAHVPEGQGVITELTVEENLRRRRWLLRDRAGRAAALADAYQRFPRAGRAASGGRPATLSGGERQILVIARALMSAPRVLLLDEPSLGLAPRMVAQVMDLIRQLRDDAGLTVLLVEQNARSALGIADHGPRAQPRQGRRRGRRGHPGRRRRAAPSLPGVLGTASEGRRAHAGVPGVHPRRDRRPA